MQEIEERANELLAAVPPYIWDGSGPPIPVEEIASSYYGLLVRDMDDLSVAPGCPKLEGDETLSGLLLPARREIWVNAAEGRQWPARRRFTIGHEIGHWVLHRDQADERSSAARSSSSLMSSLKMVQRTFPTSRRRRACSPPPS